MNRNDLNLVIVDDDQHDYEFLSRILKDFNSPLKTTWLKDGEEAISYLEKMASSKDQNPCKNVFIMDINLPKVNGLELIKEVKSHCNAKENFVIMLSGSISKSDIETAKKNGSDYFLKKPFGEKEIDEFRNLLFSKLSSLIESSA
jgi:two-component system, response regulator